MQRLMRDVVPDAFEKFFNENSIRTWSALVQDDILHAAFVLMDLITAKLKVIQQACPAIDQEEMRDEYAGPVQDVLRVPDMHALTFEEMCACQRVEAYGTGSGANELAALMLWILHLMLSEGLPHPSAVWELRFCCAPAATGAF